MGDKCSFIYLASVYEEKKIVMLHFLQSICAEDGTFPADLMGRMKDFCEADDSLKAATKVCRVVMMMTEMMIIMIEMIMTEMMIMMMVMMTSKIIGFRHMALLTCSL